MKKLTALLGCVLLGAAFAYAQELEVLETRAPDAVYFAQPFDLEFYLAHAEGGKVAADDKSFSKDFEVTASSAEEKSPTATLYHFTAVPFVLDASTFTVRFALELNGEQVAELTREVPLAVQRVEHFPDNVFREIREPKKIFDWMFWVLLFLVAVLVIAAIVYANRSHIGAKKVLHASAPVDNRPPDVIALSKIDALLNSGLWENHRYKLFYITLSDILREYLLRMFRTDVSADTSTELLRRVKGLPPFVPLVSALRDFLNSGDLVKFAQVVPPEEVRNKDIVILRNIIKQTAPKPQPQAQGVRK